jgi:acetyltransferase-like isoleucine patch superfamily enzyme
MAESGTIIDSDHTWDDDGTPWHKTPLAVTPVRVGRNVLVAAGARITRGANVGDESVVAANAVVTAGDYPPRCVLGGVPARVLKGGPDA